MSVHCTPSFAMGKSIPFAALPHDLAADPRLSPTEKLVATALLYWARAKDHCWPGDPAIAVRVGRSVGTVQRCLRRLEATGWIARERCSRSRTGRLIRLLWRTAGARPDTAPAREVPTAPARDEENVIVKPEPAKAENHPKPIPRSRPEAVTSSPATETVTPVPSPTQVVPASSATTAFAPSQTASGPPPDMFPQGRPGPALTASQKARLEELPPPARERVLAWLGSGDRILVGEALRHLAPRPARPERPTSAEELLLRIREDPSWVPAAAELLAQDLDDRKSWSGFHAACRRAWEGRLEPSSLVDAWRQATGGQARNPGAVFMTVLKRHQRGPT